MSIDDLPSVAAAGRTPLCAVDNRSGRVFVAARAPHADVRLNGVRIASGSGGDSGDGWHEVR